MKHPAFASATHLALPPFASVPSRFATARSADRRNRRICANSARFGSPASATSPPATSVTVAGALGGAAVVVGAAGAADDELGAPATISATAPAPSRQIEAAIQGVAE